MSLFKTAIAPVLCSALLCCGGAFAQGKAVKPAEQRAQTATAASKSKESPPATGKAPVSSLVPPPPPTIPATTLTFMSGMPIEMLSAGDLKKQREQTAGELERARRAESQHQSGHKEKRQRADLFASLYKEGVVSRRELESAEREAQQSEIELTDARLKAADLEADLQKLDSHLQRLSAQGRKAPASQPAARGGAKALLKTKQASR